jgi:hypothetical protein
MLRVDAMNRFAFELNNPINNVDATGHSADAVVGGLIGGLLILLAALLTVATGGAAAPLLAAGVGALVGAGLSSIIYSATHTNVAGGRFWEGFVVSAAVGGAIGAVTGFGAASFGAKVVDVAAEKIATGLLTAGYSQVATTATVTAARLGLWVAFGAATTSAGDTFNQFMSNVVDEKILGRSDVSLDDGLGRAAATGAVLGAVAGVGQTAVEFRYLKVTRGTINEEPLSSVPLRSPGEATEATRLLPRAGVRIADTGVSRALLFTVSTTSLAVDAGLEAGGY